MFDYEGFDEERIEGTASADDNSYEESEHAGDAITADETGSGEDPGVYEDDLPETSVGVTEPEEPAQVEASLRDDMRLFITEAPRGEEVEAIRTRQAEVVDTTLKKHELFVEKIAYGERQVPGVRLDLEADLPDGRTATLVINRYSVEPTGSVIVGFPDTVSQFTDNYSRYDSNEIVRHRVPRGQASSMLGSMPTTELWKQMAGEHRALKPALDLERQFGLNGFSVSVTEHEGVMDMVEGARPVIVTYHTISKLAESRFASAKPVYGKGVELGADNFDHAISGLMARRGLDPTSGLAASYKQTAIGVKGALYSVQAGTRRDALNRLQPFATVDMDRDLDKDTLLAFYGNRPLPPSLVDREQVKFHTRLDYTLVDWDGEGSRAVRVMRHTDINNFDGEPLIRYRAASALCDAYDVRKVRNFIANPTDMRAPRRT